MLIWTIHRFDKTPAELTKLCKFRIVAQIFGILIYSSLCIFATWKYGFEEFLEYELFIIIPMYTFLAFTGGEVWNRCGIYYNSLMYLTIPLHVGIYFTIRHFIGKQLIGIFQQVWLICIIHSLIDLFLITKNGLKSLPLWLAVRYFLLENQRIRHPQQNTNSGSLI